MFYFYLRSVLKMLAVFILAAVWPLMVYMPRLLFVFRGLGKLVGITMWFLVNLFRQYMG